MKKINLTQRLKNFKERFNRVPKNNSGSLCEEFFLKLEKTKNVPIINLPVVSRGDYDKRTVDFDIKMLIFPTGESLILGVYYSYIVEHYVRNYYKFLSAKGTKKLVQKKIAVLQKHIEEMTNRQKKLATLVR